MNKKLFPTILLTCVLFYIPSLYANHFNEEDWRFTTTATGNTTGHIGNLIVSNQASKANTIWLGSYIIPPKNDQQGYAVFKQETEQIEIKAGDSYVHELYGYCINVNRAPVSKEEELPHYLKWLSTKNFDTNFAERWNRTEELTEKLNFDTQLEQAAPIILEAVNNLEEQYYNWKYPLQIPDLYPGNANAVKEAVIQQALWQFTEALQGKLYSFKQFEESILKQEPVKNWLNLNGSKNVVVEEQTLSNEIYFKYQCQKLWSIITEFNFYVNPASRKLLSKWESNFGEIEEKNIKFQEIWESVALTGYHYKAEKGPKAAPVDAKETANNKKIWPFVAGGLGAAGIITGVVLLTSGGDENDVKGCTNQLACNYNEAADTDDGSCKFNDCAGICDGTSITGSICDDGDVTTTNDVYNANCECLGTKTVAGCTDATACNYNNLATVDNNSCYYENLNCSEPCKPLAGCMDTTACNYNPDACVEDGSCNFGNQDCGDPCNPVEGCTNETACNYNPDANCDDGSCSIFKCDSRCLKEGIIEFKECGKGSYYLIRQDNELLDPFFGEDVPKKNCDFFGYEGQTFLFNYRYLNTSEIDSINNLNSTPYFTCDGIATPIELFCIELIKPDCNYKIVEVSSLNKETSSFIGQLDSEVIEFYYTDCFFDCFAEGDMVKVDFEPARSEPILGGDKAVIVTCLEKAICDPENLKLGVIKFDECNLGDPDEACFFPDPHHLIEYEGNLLEPRFNCNNGYFKGYEGQEILFNYSLVPEDEIDDNFPCKNIATPVNLTCLEPKLDDCNFEQLTVEYHPCDCNGSSYKFFRNNKYELLEYVYSFEDLYLSNDFNEGDIYNIEYGYSHFEPKCSVADAYIFISCIEKVSVLKTKELKLHENEVIQNLIPFIENRILTIPVQNTEYPETTIVTNIIGINYYKPVTPTIFVNSETAIGSVLSSPLYFLNNKTTVNASNPYFPIYYGLGLNNQQLTDFIANGNWQTDVIWNVGLTLPILKKLKLEAEMFKTFNVEDAPNYTVRLIYKKEKEKVTHHLVKPFKD